MRNPILLLALLLASSALAEDGPTSYVSGFAGPSFTTSSGGGTNAIYGARVGTGLFHDNSGIFSLGVDVATGSSSQTSGSLTLSQRAWIFMGELLTRRAFGTGLYVGARAGLDTVSATATALGASASASFSSFIVGPVIGYEFDLTPQVSLDLDLSYLARGSGTITFAGTSFAVDSAQSVNTLLGVTFHW